MGRTTNQSEKNLIGMAVERNAWPYAWLLLVTHYALSQTTKTICVVFRLAAELQTPM